MRHMLFAIAICLASPLAAQTLIVGNKGEDSVSFIDLRTGRERARTPSGRMPHEVAVSPDGRQAAVVAYGGSSIDVFDVATGRRLRTVDISPNQRPHGLVWLSDGRLVATAEGTRSLAVIAPGGGVISIATGQEGSHMVAVTPDRTRAYVANIAGGTVSVLDLAKGTKLADIQVGGRPEGIALTPDGRTLWVGDLSAPRVQAFDATTRRRLGEVAIEPVAIRVAVSPDGRHVVTSNVESGSLSVIDARTRRLLRTIPVSADKAAAQVTILFSRDGRRLYAAETGRDTVAEIDLARGTVLRRIAVGRQGDGLAIAY